MSTHTQLITRVTDYVYSQNPRFLEGTPRATVETQLAEALNTVLPPVFRLDGGIPDAEAILLQMTSRLSTVDGWRDTIHTGTGQTLLRNIAAGIHTLLLAIARAQQENHYATAQARSSVYSLLNSQGVNIRRRVPRTVNTRLTIRDHDDSFVVPAYSQFVINGENYFNRVDIVYSPYDLVHDVELCQGTVFRLAGAALGQGYETYEIGYENYLISNNDVRVLVDDKAFEVVQGRAPWNYREARPLCFARTLETGNVEIKFGNGVFAQQLRPGQRVEIVWVETQGKDASEIPTGSGFVFVGADRNVEGEVLTGGYVGDNELSLEFYKTMGPHIGAANGLAARRIDMRAVALEYPGVADAVFRGAAEMGAEQRAWLNGIAATVLTKTGVEFDNAYWQRFAAYMTEQSVENLVFYRRDPLVLNVGVQANLYCRPTTNLNAVRALFETRCLETFAPRPGSLNFSLYTSDITKVVRNDPVLREAVEFMDNIRFNYAGATIPENIPQGEGITDGSVVVSRYSAVLVSTVDASVDYTSRSFQGRKELVREQ